MTLRTLTTAEAVINELGGPAATGRLCGRSVQSAWNWKTAGRLPAEFYLVISKELEARGCEAPPSVWGIAEPERAP